MPNASLTEMIDLLAKRLKINYILDPGVKGTVSIFTYGEVKPVDYMPLLETILRVNGSAMVKVGDTYRIVPVNRINQLPLSPMVNIDPKTLPDDERMVMNLIFLKYATASEIQNLVKPFLGEGAYVSVYDPANLLLIEDNARSMKRTMDLIALFDSDQFAGQRVRLFEVENSRPSDLQKELDQVFKAYALSDKAAGSVKFIPVDRINTIIAVAPNPGIFTQVESWIGKLDIAVKASSGSVNSYVYRLKYARADTVAMAIMALYSGNPFAMMALSAMANQNMRHGRRHGRRHDGGMGGGYGGGMGGGYGGMGGMGGYGAAWAVRMGGGMAAGWGWVWPRPGYGRLWQPGHGGISADAGRVAGGGRHRRHDHRGWRDRTDRRVSGRRGQPAGQWQSAHAARHSQPVRQHDSDSGHAAGVRQILGLLRQLDIPPRQVLIDAKIYEVDLSGAFAAGVTAYLEKKDSGAAGAAGRILNVASGAGGVALTTGALVLRSHELLAAVTASETKSHTRVISAPSIIATDSIAASLNVGDDVPTLTSQAVGGVTSGRQFAVHQHGVQPQFGRHPEHPGAHQLERHRDHDHQPEREFAAGAGGIQPDSIAFLPEPVFSDAGHGAGRRHGGHRRHHPGDQPAKFGGRAVPAQAAVGRLVVWRAEHHQIAHRAGGFPDAAGDLRHQPDGGSDGRNPQQHEEDSEAHQRRVGQACRRPAQSPQPVSSQGAQFVLGKRADAEFPGFGELASGILAHHHVAGLPAHGAGDFAAGLLDQLLGLIAAQGGQGSGDDQGLALQGARLGTGGRVAELEARLAQAAHQFAVAGLAEILHHGLGDLGSDFLGQLQLFERCVLNRVHAAEGLGQEDGGALADEADAQSGDDSRQRVLAGAVDIADHVAGALDAHALQVDEVGEFQVVEIGHVAHVPRSTS
jgi:general secretion pathway protein D